MLTAKFGRRLQESRGMEIDNAVQTEREWLRQQGADPDRVEVAVLTSSRIPVAKAILRLTKSCCRNPSQERNCVSRLGREKSTEKASKKATSSIPLLCLISQLTRFGMVCTPIHATPIYCGGWGCQSPPSDHSDQKV